MLENLLLTFIYRLQIENGEGMNDTIKTILSRRSVRNYSNKQINDEELELIIKAGLYAPSARNQQSWHFTVIQDKKLIDALNIAAKDEMLKSGDVNLKKYLDDDKFHLFYDSPTVIVVSGEKSATAPRIDCAEIGRAHV